MSTHKKERTQAHKDKLRVAYEKRKAESGVLAGRKSNAKKQAEKDQHYLSMATPQQISIKPDDTWTDYAEKNDAHKEAFILSKIKYDGSLDDYIKEIYCSVADMETGITNINISRFPNNTLPFVCRVFNVYGNRGFKYHRFFADYFAIVIAAANKSRNTFKIVDVVSLLGNYGWTIWNTYLEEEGNKSEYEDDTHLITAAAQAKDIREKYELEIKEIQNIFWEDLPKYNKLRDEILKRQWEELEDVSEGDLWVDNGR